MTMEKNERNGDKKQLQVAFEGKQAICKEIVKTFNNLIEMDIIKKTGVETSIAIDHSAFGADCDDDTVNVSYSCKLSISLLTLYLYGGAGIEKLIKKLNKGIEEVKTEGDDPDDMGWNRQVGVLITSNEARLIVAYLLQNKR